MEKDLKLLRKFDPEAAKRGEQICLFDGSSCVFVAGPDARNIVCCSTEALFLQHPGDLRMAPLCWVEGRPVYKGDVLWHVVAGPGTAVSSSGKEILLNYARWPGDLPCGAYPENLTWPPPKVKREGFVVVAKGQTLPTIEAAEAMLRLILDGEKHFVIAKAEWEEPAGQEGGAV